MAAAEFARLTIIAIMITAAASQTRPTAYSNHTVGGNAGWFFNSTTNSSAANYSSWATSLTFYLGDYLIFNTTSNQTVIQTYNSTTFRSCTTDDDSSNDTFQYQGGTTSFNEALTIPVPLTNEGPNYFFSDADDGTQCQNGLAFEIQVKHGLGLPPSLNQPPPPPYREPPGPDSAQSPPITIAGGSDTSLNAGVKGSANVHGVVYAVLFAAVAGFILF